MYFKKKIERIKGEVRRLKRRYDLDAGSEGP